MNRQMSLFETSFAAAIAVAEKNSLPTFVVAAENKPQICFVLPPKAGNFIKPSYWEDLMLYLTPGESRPAIMLVGPAGNGKTTAAEEACKANSYDYLVIDANEYLEPADLVGSATYDPQKGEVWRDGPVAQAFREGKAIIINEFDALNPRAAMCLQSAMQDAGASGQGRYVTTPGAAEHDRIYPTGSCPLILTANTYGTGPNRQYVGRNTMDAASMDRITIISTGYENEAAILEARGYSNFTATRLEAWAKTTRKRIEDNALRVILSNRTLLRMAQMIERYGRSFEVAIDKEFLARLDADTRELLA
ncbi:MAG: AAA family ATPase [Chloroflexi bacterium]|nr:AAA family ATPase [Chloroflexota bacterium]